MVDLNTFICENKNKIFRMYKYKKVYTPYEQDKKFSDETMFENGGYATYVNIVDMIVLPDKDVLLKLKYAYNQLEDCETDDNDDNDDNDEVYLYEKLSDIVLQEHNLDNLNDEH